ncbi:cell adhesion molecule Dscam1-like [Tachypleus tridentatus]|uniref:cell adhesion molecule Dscam1-like n=1 Tax=Tachypleus tridentatus TaxID=6853 RepID=UPI003FD64599
MKENNGVKCKKLWGLLGNIWFIFNRPALQFGFIFLVTGVAGEVTRDYLQGPFFSLEPNHLVEFSNNSGAEVKCSATGRPWPALQWTNREGQHIQDVTGIRYITSDGTLVFAPFKPDDYRQDIHAAVYTCVASNKVGSIRSRDVQVRAGKVWFPFVSTSS